MTYYGVSYLPSYSEAEELLAPNTGGYAEATVVGEKRSISTDSVNEKKPSKVWLNNNMLFIEW